MEKIGLEEPLPVVHNAKYYLEDEMSVFLVWRQTLLVKSDSNKISLPLSSGRKPTFQSPPTFPHPRIPSFPVDVRLSTSSGWARRRQ